ncbi:DMT family transporter [Phyllobacterium sp. YR531]|uniref:DMT family transporter n=1 Tax=Phyllobacterium sp. YR531 TaxID=1144343 RepID=UPI00026F490F|nr:DMT family transporter [Phyllobacterium sp. YR531]EJN05552.1 DMT(drug/metabolite transporter) superfamily permease [Phyllobacterium sp. YR531]
MSEVWGVLAAMFSSALGGSSIGATRYLAHIADPIAIGSFRFGVGFVLLLPVAISREGNWPSLRDLPAVAALGLLFFAVFPGLFNASLMFTTAARGALALSTLPLMTMLIGAALGIERLTIRKTTGVLIATTGVATALVSGLQNAPSGAWKGDLLMGCAALCMAFYSIWSRPYIQRSGAIRFTTVAMGVGAILLICAGCLNGSFAPVADFTTPQWFAIVYLGAFGSALTFYLWAFALERTTPTRVAVSIAVNPISASLVGATVLHEPLGWNLALGTIAVVAGIWIATRHSNTTSV